MQTLPGGVVLPSAPSVSDSSDAGIVIDVDAASAAPAGASTMAGPSGGEVVSLPERIGHYKIHRLIGAGGMGAVYEAEQDQPRRTVALKVMRGALSSPQASRRFEYESELLARLRHPGIAQVYEAGTHTEASTGLAVPYFAMEFIPEAKELCQYADAHNLDRAARIALFQRVCDAVQHGHQRGVIHRDLKPANILVDSAGNPKIIDFGVARASTEEGDPRVTQQTTPGQMIGTLQYMAPEQCGGDSGDIDVRADVYALGVILFELLSGRPPYELEGKSLFEAAMIVREDPPTRPGTIVRDLRGDLETILLKALEKNRAQRYDSAADFAADLARHLRCEPIVARHIGVAGRLTRWVKRNRAVATVIAASSVVLISTSVLLIARILAESKRANEALVVAERNLRAANDNFALVRNMFSRIRPDETRGGLVDVGSLVDSAAESFERKEPELPETRADFREFLGEAYRGVGEYAKEVEVRRRAVEIREALVKGADRTLANSLHNYAAALWWNGQYDEALPIYKRALAMRIELLGSEHEDVAQSMSHIAACLLKQGKVDEGQRFYEQALTMRRSLAAKAARDLAAAQDASRAPAAGGKEAQDAAAARTAEAAANAAGATIAIAASLNNLSKPHAIRGEYAEAERLLRESLRIVSAGAGEDSLNTVTAELNLAMCLLEQGKAEEALPLLRHVLEQRSAKYRPDHPAVANAQLALARCLFEINPDSTSAAMAKQAAQWISEAGNKAMLDQAEALGYAGLMYAKLGETEQAMILLERSVKVYADAKQTTPRDRAEGALRLGLGFAYLGQDGLAGDTLRPALETLGPMLVTPSLRAEAAEALAAIYERAAKPHEAALARGWAVRTVN
ncbi:MAG: serine/threonine protein kinase [Phycisphaerae bacterium]|nr:serine/threonine protein kinase [Phycisphaerae bacterium]